jgi:hypothetical protein
MENGLRGVETAPRTDCNRILVAVVFEAANAADEGVRPSELTTWSGYPITVVCSGRILYITRTSPGFA